MLVLGEDVSNTAARVALALRQAARGTSLEMAASAGIPAWQDAGIRGHGQHHRSPVFIASVLPTRIDDIARETLRATPTEIARAGFAVAHRVDAAFADAGTEHDAFVQEAATALANAERPLIVTGAGCADASVLEAAANIAWALKARGGDPALLIASGEANTLGVAAMPAGLSMEAALEAMSAGEADTLVVLENDLYRRADAERVTAALSAGEAAGQVIVLDALETRTAEAASVALPAATYAESTGTFVNYEGRAQRFYRVFEPDDEIAPSWQWIARMANAAGRNDCNWADINALAQACARAVPALSGIAAVAPAADFRVEAEQKIPRQPHRYSGRTAMRADVNIHEPKTTVDTETPFSYSMEGENTGGQPGSVVPYVWTPGWNSNQSVFKFQQEVGGPLRGGDPGVRLFDADDAGDDRAARFRDAPETVAWERRLSTGADPCAVRERGAVGAFLADPRAPARAVPGAPSGGCGARRRRSGCRHHRYVARSVLRGPHGREHDTGHRGRRDRLRRVTRSPADGRRGTGPRPGFRARRRRPQRDRERLRRCPSTGPGTGATR